MKCPFRNGASFGILMEAIYCILSLIILLNMIQMQYLIKYFFAQNVDFFMKLTQVLIKKILTEDLIKLIFFVLKVETLFFILMYCMLRYAYNTIFLGS